MRRSTAAFFIAVLLFLAGCGARTPDEPRAADFSFILPPGASFADMTDTTASIILDGQLVGGMTLTDIEGKRMDKLDDDSLFRYIDSCVPMPLIGEWISMYFEVGGHSIICVNLKVTDPETNIITNYSHTFFMKEEGVYDLWLDDSLVDEELRDLFIDLVVTS